MTEVIHQFLSFQILQKRILPTSIYTIKVNQKLQNKIGYRWITANIQYISHFSYLPSTCGQLIKKAERFWEYMAARQGGLIGNAHIITLWLSSHTSWWPLDCFLTSSLSLVLIYTKHSTLWGCATAKSTEQHNNTCTCDEPPSAHPLCAEHLWVETNRAYAFNAHTRHRPFRRMLKCGRVFLSAHWIKCSI